MSRSRPGPLRSAGGAVLFSQNGFRLFPGDLTVVVGGHGLDVLAAQLVEEDEQQHRQGAEESALCKGKLRLVPFRSLGGGGLLPVFRPEALWVDGKRREDLLVALSREARGEGFDAIL